MTATAHLKALWFAAKIAFGIQVVLFVLVGRSETISPLLACAGTTLGIYLTVLALASGSRSTGRAEYSG